MKKEAPPQGLLFLRLFQPSESHFLHRKQSTMLIETIEYCNNPCYTMATALMQKKVTIEQYERLYFFGKGLTPFAGNFVLDLDSNAGKQLRRTAGYLKKAYDRALDQNTWEI